MLITLPPQAVFDFENTVSQLPQHQELIFTDPNDSNLVQRHTIYTGELFSPGGGPLLNADDHHKDLTFQFLLIGTFFPSPPDPPGSGPPTVGIKPIGDDREHRTLFRSAVADAAVTSAEWGSNPVWADVSSVSADLVQIQLDSGQPPINVVALMGILTSRNSQITRISYRVTVLDRQAPQGNVKFIPTIFKGFSGWGGKYIGFGSLVKPGIPQDKID